MQTCRLSMSMRASCSIAAARHQHQRQRQHHATSTSGSASTTPTHRLVVRAAEHLVAAARQRAHGARVPRQRGQARQVLRIPHLATAGRCRQCKTIGMQDRP